MDHQLAADIETLIKQSAARDESRELFRTPLAGFSAADDALFDKVVAEVGPHHQKPRDFLPSARSVISFFIPFSREVVQTNRGGEEVSELWGKSYVAANKLINRLNGEICDLLAQRGYEGASVAATHTYDPQTLKAAWSHRSAAFVGGLGRFGLNRMLITKMGCAGRYGTVFTSAQFPPNSRPQEEPCRYYASGSCQACLKACPISALSDGGFEKFRCQEHLHQCHRRLRDMGIEADACGKCVVSGPCAFHEAVA